MIQSFKNKDTEKLFNGQSVRSLPADVLKRAFVKLQMLNASTCINDLRVPPSNHLEALSGDRKGQFSMRINDRYRICFEWDDNSPINVEIVDYHK